MQFLFGDHTLDADRRELQSPQGGLVTGILLFQDFCLAPMIVLTPVLAGSAAATGAIAITYHSQPTRRYGRVRAKRRVIPEIPSRSSSAEALMASLKG